MYNFILSVFAFLMRLISPFHKKVGLMVRGHKNTWRTLREKIDPTAKYVWFHVASLGEFEQARPMIETLKKEHPQYRVLLTFFSPSGYEVRKDYPLADMVCYLPFDTKRNAKRFVEMVNPHIVIFVKYEFWYNFIHQCYRRKLPVYLVSAIFRKEQVFFKKNRGRYGKMLHLYSEIFVQDEKSKKLLNTHGITCVTVTGDTRLDRVIEIRQQAKSLPIIEKFVSGSDLVLIAGSSWAPDENIFIEYFNAHPEMKLIIAPHEIHESHLLEIQQKLNRNSIRYSQANEENVSSKDCLLIDCFGLLSSIYRYGHIAYIGGGFGAGIHNLPEAAVYGIPVIFGPNYRKFREAYGLIGVKGGFSIKSAEDFNQLMNEFLSFPKKREQAGENSRTYIYENAGATQKIITKIMG